jgi:predicted RNA binding protein YcfA (HicA-like mRNA interferase family)
MPIRGLPSREVIARLEADGWRLARVKGDHHQYRHPIKKGTVTVPHPWKDIPIGTLRHIFKTAGLPLE